MPRYDTIAVIFDFDDTLVPDSLTRLLRQHGIDAHAFWNKTKDLVQQGYDTAPAYLRQFLDLIGTGEPLGNLTNADLIEFGNTLDTVYFPGIPDIFTDLQAIVSQFKDIRIEFYMISGGLRQIIEGSNIVKAYFRAVYASELAGDSTDGQLKYIKRCVTFTEKTRYVFEINKGVDATQGYKEPQLVNRFVDPRERPIPLRNMIYIGDGLTDIPCFSLVGKGTYAEKGGTTFGVFDPNEEEKAKIAFRNFLKEGRVVSTHFPRYRKTDELGTLLRMAVAARCTDIQLEREQPGKY